MAAPFVDRDLVVRLVPLRVVLPEDREHGEVCRGGYGIHLFRHGSA